MPRVDRSANKSKFGRSSIWLAKLLVSIALFWIILEQVDFEEILDRLDQAIPTVIALAIGTILMSHLLGAMRWKRVMRAIGEPLPFLSSVRITLIGLFFNSALPSIIGGDAMRAWELTRLGMPLGKATSGVLMDRMSALIALVIIVAVGEPYLLSVLDQMPMRIFVMLIPLTLVVGFGALYFSGRISFLANRSRLARAAAGVIADSRTVFLRVSSAAPILCYSIVIQMLIGLSVFLLAMGLRVELDIVSCIVFMPLVLLVSTVPISIAGWGVREAAMVTAFAMVGVPATEILIVSVAFGISIAVTGLPGGAVWLIRRRAKNFDSECPAVGSQHSISS